MSYSRARTREKKRSKRIRKFRYLLALNTVLLAAAAGVVWLLTETLKDGGKPAVHGPAATQPAAPPEVTSEAPASPTDPVLASSPPLSGAASPSVSPASTSGGTNDPEGEPRGDRVTLAFVGDVLPAGSVARLMEQLGYDYPFRKARGLLESADIAAGNLESAITDRGVPEENKEYLFRGPVESLPAIRDAGFDVLSLANNHTLDYGWVGLQDTMDALDDHDIRHVGAGADDREAFSPVYLEANGITVAFIGVSNVVPEVSWKAGPRNPGVAELYDPKRAVEAVREADQNADLVVVMAHWGVERSETPEEYQVDKGRMLIDAGADLVIGSHPHVLQGMEAYNGKWIAYSLGNFVFNVTASPQTAETGVLMAECGKDGACELTFHPMKAVSSQPAPMEEETGKALLGRISARSTFAEIGENGKLVAER